MIRPGQHSTALVDDFSESDLPWKVDIVDWATLSEAIRKIIERDKVVVQLGEDPAGAAATGHSGAAATGHRSVGGTT